MRPVSSLWRRPSALLLALLLALDAALGAGAAAPHAEHAPRAPAATASSQCSGTTSPACSTPGQGGCSTSSDLSAAECSAWVDLYDKAGGAGWTDCSQNRLDPCACNGATYGVVECQNSQITYMYARAARTPRSPGPDRGARSRCRRRARARARPPVRRRRG